MSSTYSANPDHSSRPSCYGYCRKGNWSGANIFAMVLGFIIFPPLGLVVLFWTLAGYPIQDLPGAIRNKWHEFKASGKSERSQVHSDNVVFSEYQQTQYDRIRELKEEILNRAERFKDFRADAKRRADQEEFDQFMSSKPKSDDQ